MVELNPASAVRLTRDLSQSLGCCPAEPEDLRTRAARYRRLIETLADPRVIAVVQACALELETKAVLIETADEAWGSIQPSE